jgi:hypothetical protein
MAGIPTQVPPIGSTPASTSSNTVNGGGSSVDGPIVTSLALSGTPSDPNQPIEISAQQTPVAVVRGDATSVGSPPADTLAASGTSADANQTVGVSPAQTAQTSINGGTFSPQGPNVINTTQNNVVGQVLGTGTPRNVFV